LGKRRFGLVDFIWRCVVHRRVHDGATVAISRCASTIVFGHVATAE
jgi:hypothetical protein